MEPTSVKQLLWIRVGALGDLLIATAALEETLRRFPNAEISILGEKLWTELLEPALWPRVRRIWSLSGRELEEFLPSGSGWASLDKRKSFAQVTRQMDAVVNHRIESFRYSWAPFFLHVPIRIGSSPAILKHLYTHWSPWLGKDPVIHERDWHLWVASAKPHKSISVEAARREFSNWQKQNPWQKKGLPQLRTPRTETLKNHQLNPKKYFLINPTSSRIEKAWPAPKFREAALTTESHFQKKGIEIVIIGSPKETQWLREVSGENFKVIQPENLSQLIDVVAGAEGLLSNTSSMQFIAATTNTKALTLMGRAKKEIWGPLGPHDDVVRVSDEVLSQLKGSIFEIEQQGFESISIDSVTNKICLMWSK